MTFIPRTRTGFYSCSIFLAIVFPGDFQDQFKPQIEQVFVQLKQAEPLICQAYKDYGEHPAEVMAMVAPEMVRYNLFRDFFETKAIELVYVSLGSREADFSIGQFQMKPSFIEKLEHILREFPMAFPQFQFICDYPLVDERGVRKERINRLKSQYWQIQYAFAFYAVCQACFYEKNCGPADERVALFAAAYNMGIGAKISDLQNWIDQKAFPYGLKYKGTQWSYSHLSVDFFHQLNRHFSCEKSGSTNP